MTWQGYFLVVAIFLDVRLCALKINDHHPPAVGETGLFGVELLGTAVAVLMADCDQLCICQVRVELFFGERKDGVEFAVILPYLGICTVRVYPCASVTQEPVMDLSDIEGDILCQLDLTAFAETEKSGQEHGTRVCILAHGFGGGDGGTDGAAAALIEILSSAVVYCTAFQAVNGENDFIPLFVAWFELPEYSMPYSGFTLTKEEEEYCLWKWSHLNFLIIVHQKNLILLGNP